MDINVLRLLLLLIAPMPTDDIPRPVPPPIVATMSIRQESATKEEPTEVNHHPEKPTTQLPITGKATRYAPGLMSRVIKNQIGYGNIPADPCPGCIGFVAMRWPADLNRIVCIRDTQNNQEFLFGPYYVVDSAQARHVQELIDGDWVIDMSYKSFVELGFPTNNTRIVVVEECTQHAQGESSWNG